MNRVACRPPVRSWLPPALMLSLAACVSTGGIANPAGVPATDLDPAQRGLVSGTGIEGQDIVSMTDRMTRDLLAASFLAGLAQPPRIIVDDQYFKNEGSQPINKKIITDKLRVGLNRAAQGRMTFVGRQFSAAVEDERALKRSGVTDTGTAGLTRAAHGADFRLVGAIQTLDSRGRGSGLEQRYNHIFFELIDLETSDEVWSGEYEFSRAAADDVIYR